MTDFDSRIDTHTHINVVRRLINQVIINLLRRSEDHDKSKLVEPELSVFNEYTPKLADMEYGSDEYREALEGMKVGLKHHYAHNSHHPEHYTDGIRGMSLMDLTEMLVDWKAATLRHDPPSSLMKSIEINQERFGYSDELKQILFNTAHDLHLHDGNFISGHQRTRSTRGIPKVSHGEE